MQSVRAPAVAGTFYPAGREELRAEVAGLLAAAAPGPAPKALIAPHAGYIYSGPVAASIFRRVQGASFERVVLLGPAHYAYLDGLALPEAAAFSTPLGDVPLELPDGLPHDRAAHAREHSLEVELPFLQIALAGPWKLVPLAGGGAGPAEGAGVIDSPRGGPRTLVVVSSDLSHYLPYREARTMDAATAREILALRRLDSHAACGASPVTGLLLAARHRKLSAELVDSPHFGEPPGSR